MPLGLQGRRSVVESGGFSREALVVINGLAIAFLSVIGWNVRQQIKRTDQNQQDIESLHELKVDESTFNETLKALRSDIKDSRKEIREDIKDLHLRINGEPRK